MPPIDEEKAKEAEELILRITEDVLAAGAEQLLACVVQNEDLGIAVARVYFAMELARRNTEEPIAKLSEEELNKLN